jgi:hypothetical protein
LELKKKKKEVEFKDVLVFLFSFFFLLFLDLVRECSLIFRNYILLSHPHAIQVAHAGPFDYQNPPSTTACHSLFSGVARAHRKGLVELR